MAITVSAQQPSSHGFAVNGSSADLSGCETLVAAPGEGRSLRLAALTISTGAAMSVTIGTGESGGAVETVVFGPVYLAANTQFVKVFREPLLLAENKPLTVDTSAAGNVTVFVEGDTR